MADEVAKRGEARRRRGVVAHKAHSYEEAEAWDLQYWLGLSPTVRIEALEAMRRQWGLIRGDHDR